MCLFLSKIDYNQQRINPRLRGEKDISILARFDFSGSPPPTRGKDDLVRRMSPQLGITPAYAGKRTAQLSTRYLPWDHPRLRGEKRTGIKFAVHT